MSRSGAWYTIVDDKGKSHRFQSTKWLEMLKNEDFRQAVYDIMDEVIIQKFDTTQEEIDLQEE